MSPDRHDPGSGHEPAVRLLTRERRSVGASVLAGTVVESGAIDITTEKVGPETMFARIVALVEQADSEKAPVQRLADRVASWLVPVVVIFGCGTAADALAADEQRAEGRSSDFPLKANDGEVVAGSPSFGSCCTNALNGSAAAHTSSSTRPSTIGRSPSATRPTVRAGT